MSFLLKIIEGPNKGAEIALPEGVAVTIGKSDDCDIVLADPTLPDEPATVAATEVGVTLDGSPLEQFLVVTRGATAFAAGPADQPWGELKRETENGLPADLSAKASAAAEALAKAGEPGTGDGEGAETPEAASKETSDKKRGHGGCLGCLFVLLLLVVAAAIAGWFFREQAKPYVERARPYIDKTKPYVQKILSKCTGKADASDGTITLPPETIESIATRYGLSLTNRAGRIVLVGDFATRAERLFATAEAYAVKPGIEIDFCDDESLRTAAEDTFALVGETKLRVDAATNRFVVISGVASNLRRTLEALAADLPRLRNVDVSGVKSGGSAHGAAAGAAASAARLASKKASSALPVCGILTSPYPCIVLRNGTRVMEGAPLGGSVVVKIEADCVTLTNSTGRFTWKP